MFAYSHLRIFACSHISMFAYSHTCMFTDIFAPSSYIINHHPSSSNIIIQHTSSIIMHHHPSSSIINHPSSSCITHPLAVFSATFSTKTGNGHNSTPMPPISMKIKLGFVFWTRPCRWTRLEAPNRTFFQRFDFWLYRRI